jgi:ubiquinone/menaquinone biosynthesis C-methylase UbiE
MTSLKYWNINYHTTGFAEQSPFTKELHTKILELIPSNTQKILDVGCGSGVLMNKIRNIGEYKIVGTDLSEEAVRIVKNNLKHDCFVGSITNLKLEDKSFDTVICSEVLEHLFEEDLEKAFSELVRVSKGTIIISTPLLENLEYHHTKCSNCKTVFHPAGHIRQVNESFLISYVQKYSSNYSFYYTGKREPRINVYSKIIRLLRGHVVWLENLMCPICNSKIDKSPLSFFSKIVNMGYRLFQKILFSISFNKYNNIIMIVHL